MSHKIEEFVKVEKKLNANVDFYIGFHVSQPRHRRVDLFTPIFAVSRVSGWAAHVMEQLCNDNRLIRPRAEYLGPDYPNPYVAESTSDSICLYAVDEAIAFTLGRWNGSRTTVLNAVQDDKAISAS